MKLKLDENFDCRCIDIFLRAEVDKRRGLTTN